LLAGIDASECRVSSKHIEQPYVSKHWSPPVQGNRTRNLNGCFGLPARRNECQVLKIVAVSYGLDAEFLERQLIDCVPYYPKPDIENAEIP
jgi:hypothetical protein